MIIPGNTDRSDNFAQLIRAGPRPEVLGELLDQSCPEARIPAAQRLDRNVHRMTLSHEAVVLQHKCLAPSPSCSNAVR